MGIPGVAHRHPGHALWSPISCDLPQLKRAPGELQGGVRLDEAGNHSVSSDVGRVEPVRIVLEPVLRRATHRDDERTGHQSTSDVGVAFDTTRSAALKEVPAALGEPLSSGARRQAPPESRRAVVESRRETYGERVARCLERRHEVYAACRADQR